MIKILGQEYNLGSFNIKSSEMIIGDPCYSPNAWYSGHANKVLNGQWESKVFRADDSITNWGDRNTALFAFNKKYFEDNFNIDYIEVERFINGAYKNQFCLDVELKNFCVDSGQAGIYDLAHYIKMYEQDKEKRKTDNLVNSDSTWYWTNNAIVTLYGMEAGVNPDKMGCVSSSGYGDGGYDYYIYRNKEGFTVAISIIFITEEEVE